MLTGTLANRSPGSAPRDRPRRSGAPLQREVRPAIRASKTVESLVQIDGGGLHPRRTSPGSEINSPSQLRRSSRRSHLGVEDHGSNSDTCSLDLSAVVPAGAGVIRVEWMSTSPGPALAGRVAGGPSTGTRSRLGLHEHAPTSVTPLHARVELRRPRPRSRGRSSSPPPRTARPRSRRSHPTHRLAGR